MAKQFGVPVPWSKWEQRLAWFIGACALTVIGVGAIRLIRPTEAPPVQSSQPAVAQPLPAQAQFPSLAELLRADDLRAVIDLLRPHFRDTTNGVDPSAVQLAAWLGSFGDWGDVMLQPATTRPLAMRDIEPERGKHLCVAGTIGEIRADRSTGQLFYEGSVITSSLDVVRFLAVRSAGGIVESSTARFCGIVTGRMHYANTGGGETHAIHAVGFFDLPENRREPYAGSSAPVAPRTTPRVGGPWPAAGKKPSESTANTRATPTAGHVDAQPQADERSSRDPWAR